MSRSSTIAGSVATVAIAGLAGPLAQWGVAGAMTAEALKGSVGPLQKAFLKDAATRDLHKAIEAAVVPWANGEINDSDATRAGLQTCLEVLAGFPATHDDIAAFKFQADRVADAVIARGRRHYRDWHTDYVDRDEQFAVAERAIRAAYAKIVAADLSEGGLLLAAVRASQAGIDQIAGVQAGIAEVLVDGASSAEVMGYLTARMRDWDRWDWVPDKPAPSVLARRLQARAGGQVLSADDALDGQSMLVVLGDPGAGKTWQARRYARRAAQVAYDRLLAGATVADVEIPIYTTWDTWTKAGAAGIREGLVAAGLASGSDVGGADVVGRLARTLTVSRQPVLAVIDSLDEAAGSTNQATRLRDLAAGVAGWQVVVTSRHGAWHAATAGKDPDGFRVVTLLDLDPKEEVPAFIEAWFGDHPDRATSLIKQMDKRADLDRMAVLPLLLTFLCILADDPDVPLPATRRGLYREVLNRLVASAWANAAPGQDAQLATEEVLALLTTWAWQAVGHANTPAGLGDWADAFTPTTAIPRAFSDPERKALDNVAPRVDADQRRFRHRTLLEHLVAEHIARLDTAAAAEVLLPHLWYDPDWAVAAPAAIAAHSQEHPDKPGALLECLLQQALPDAPDRVRQEAALQIDYLLRAVATESQPDQWPAPPAAARTRARYGRGQTRHGIGEGCDATTETWSTSNHDETRKTIEALPTVSRRKSGSVAEALVGLTPTPEERAAAREVIVGALPTAHPIMSGLITTALVELAPTPEERAAARQMIVGALPDARSFAVSCLASLLMGDDLPSDEWKTVRAEIIMALPYADPGQVAALVEELVRLNPEPAQREVARAKIIKALPSGDLWTVEDLLPLLRRECDLAAWMRWIAARDSPVP